MSTGIQTTPASARPEQRETRVPEVIIYGHSWVLYWWPLWVVGYVMALLTWMHHDQVLIGDRTELFHPSRNLGVVFTLIALLMIVITNTQMRGMVSAFVVVTVAFFALLFAYLDWWGTILDWLGNQSVYLNLGFYLFFSTALMLIWVATVFVIDHLSFWRVRPGQISHEYFLGAVDQSYDTDMLVFSKSQNDLFRHWILGLGSGDLHMQTMGGRGLEASIDNVLFVGSKVFKIQRLVATKPEVPQEA
jgi:hypothetical protein